MRVLLTLCLALGLLYVEAKPRTKRSKTPTVLLQCDLATYTYRKSGVRLIGHVYSFHVKSMAPGLIIDSVWFGATPVPCDVYDATGQPADTLKRPGAFLIKANRDLYRLFPEQADSSTAARTFRTPFAYPGQPVIMYWYKGKRGYVKVKGVEERRERVRWE